jgi:hypothetical protein
MAGKLGEAYYEVGIRDAGVLSALARDEGKFREAGSAAQSALGTGVQKAADEAESALGRIQTKSEGLLGKLKGFGGSILSGVGMGAGMLGFQAVGAAIGGLAQSMIGGAAEFEQYEVQFRVLLGSADAAKRRMADLAEFAKTTPFELPEVVSADKVLQSFGIESAKQLRIVGDAAAGTGASIEDLAGTFGRISTGQMGEAFQRLAELGIATRTQLEAKGLKFDAGGSYKGSVAQAMTAVNEIVAGKFGGMMDAQSATFNGAMSNLSDTINGTLRDVGTMILPFLKGVALGLTSAIAGIREGLGKVAEFVSAIFSGPMLQGVTGPLAKIGEFVQSAFSRIAGAVGPLVEKVGPAIGRIFGTIGGIIGDLAPKLSPVIDALLKLGNVIVDQVVAGFGILVPLIDPFVSVIQAVWEIVGKLAGLFLDLLGPAISTVADVLQGLWAIATPVAQFLAGVMGAALGTLAGLFQGLGTAIDAVAGIIRSGFNAALDLIGNGIALLLEPIRALVDLASKIPGPWQEALGSIRDGIDKTQASLESWGTASAAAAETANAAAVSVKDQREGWGSIVGDLNRTTTAANATAPAIASVATSAAKAMPKAEAVVRASADDIIGVLGGMVHSSDDSWNAWKKGAKGGTEDVHKRIDTLTARLHKLDSVDLAKLGPSALARWGAARESTASELGDLTTFVKNKATIVGAALPNALQETDTKSRAKWADILANATSYGNRTASAWTGGFSHIVGPVTTALTNLRNVLRADSPPGPASPLHEIDRWGARTADAYAGPMLARLRRLPVEVGSALGGMDRMLPDLLGDRLGIPRGLQAGAALEVRVRHEIDLRNMPAGSTATNAGVAAMVQAGVDASVYLRNLRSATLLPLYRGGA